MKRKKEKSSKRSKRSKSSETPPKRPKRDDSKSPSPAKRHKNESPPVKKRVSTSPEAQKYESRLQAPSRKHEKKSQRRPEIQHDSFDLELPSEKKSNRHSERRRDPSDRDQPKEKNHQRHPEGQRDSFDQENSSSRRREHLIGSRYYDGGRERPEEDRRPDRERREGGGHWGGRKYHDRDLVVGSRYYDVRQKEREQEREAEPRPRTSQKDTNVTEKEEKVVVPRKQLDPISSKTGGAYIPPAMLKLMQASITDKSSAEYQRISWEALKKSIHGLINKVNRTNIDKIIRQLLKENIVRGRGLLCRSIIQAQAMSTTFTHVYAALVALINSRFPNIGELILKRLVIQFRRGFKRNDKAGCIAAATFIAHLVNQRVAHEILALEILTLLVETPTDDSIEVAIAFLKECGMKLTEVSSKGVDAIIQMLRNVLHERSSDSRSMHMIQVMMQIRKDKFKDNESIPDGLDLVEEEDQFTHLITLDDATDGQDILNVFKVDPEYLEHEEKYKELSKEIVGDDSEDGDSDEDGDDDDEEDDEEGAEDDGESGPSKQVIVDNTETNAVALRRTIYLTIYSSLDFEECAHKLMRMNLKPGQEPELCAMILDCCCEMRTYERFYGLLAQRFCQVNRAYIPPFESLFRDTYSTVHRLKTSQCRNVAKLFAHLLFTDAISWNVLACIRLNEEDTTSSGRIFIKILFHELSEYMGLVKLNDRVKDVTLQDAFSGLFPRDNPRSTRFSINFFTSIGLGGLTDELREHLKTAVQTIPAQLPGIAADVDASSSSSESSSSEESSDSSSEDSSDDSSDDDKRKVSKKKRDSKQKNKKEEPKHVKKKSSKKSKSKKRS